MKVLTAGSTTEHYGGGVPTVGTGEEALVGVGEAVAATHWVVDILTLLVAGYRIKAFCHSL